MLNRNQIARRFAKRTSNTIEHSESLIKALEDIVVEVLSEGESINLQGFGEIYTTIQEATSGVHRNPQTGEFVDTDRKIKAKCKLSECVDRKLNQ